MPRSLGLLLRRLVPAAILAAALAATGCSSGSGTKGEGGFGGDGTNQTLLGAWTGHYGTRSTQIGAPLVDTHPAHAVFQGNQDDTAGQFKIDLTDQTNATVSGTFTRYMNTDLQLQIGFSTISTIGTDLQYKMLGNSLELQNDQIALQLTRDTGTTDGSGNNGSTQQGTGLTPGSADPAMGTWICNDPKGNRWQLLTRDNGSFDIDVFAPGAARGGLFLDGTLTITRGKTGSDADAELVVNSSSVAKYVGWDYRMNVAGSTATLRRMQASPGQAPTAVETDSCQKQ